MDVYLVDLVQEQDGAGCPAPEQERACNVVGCVESGQGERDDVVEGDVGAYADESEEDAEDGGGEDGDDGDFGSRVDLALGLNFSLGEFGPGGEIRYLADVPPAGDALVASERP